MLSPMNNDFLFVYGTLRQAHRIARYQPHPMHQVLAQHSHYVGGATCLGRLFDIGQYPGLVPPLRQGERVVGELYRLKLPERALALLDEYERYWRARPKASEFIREPWRVESPELGTVSAWVYRYNRPVRGLRRLPGGDYCATQIRPANTAIILGRRV